ncbi:MAG: tRNA (N(6)-L-threonylcarbamoyladenosine(37)-C(2))-methylthiotransferase MtaB [Bacteroidota bacterium]
MNKKRKIAFKTLGCRLNQYETDALVSKFHHAGYEIVDFGRKDADVTVINTCTVTNQSDQKSRNYINQSARLSPSGLNIVAGCMANHHKEELEKQENITYVIENEKKNSIFSLVEAHFNNEIIHPDHLKSDVFGFDPVEKSVHTRTSIKIQDGCDNFCTFCIIPKVRGRATSRPVNDILENIRRVTTNGFKEIVLTGVNISRYDYEGQDFKALLEKILELPGDFRVRISSIEPDGFSDDFPQLFDNPRLAPHLHLCLQSGSDSILMKMRRMYNVSTFMHIIENFRKRIPDFNFTTDIIVGFPGETDDDFDKTIQLAKDAAFSHIHTFRYSVRNGTRAARMEKQIPEKIKAERSEVIRKLSLENEIKYYKSMLGKNQRLLIENPDFKGFARGYGENYLPLRLPAKGFNKNQFINVKLNKTDINNSPFVICSTI